jgi:mannitol/fructose-specific phosphotransferase system IIA component (Ntr-type)
MMPVILVPSALDPSLYIPELKSRRRDSVLAELVACAARAGVVRRVQALLDLLERRESLWPSAIGKSVALPAARSLSVAEPRLVIGRSRRGIEWNAPDRQPAHLVVLSLAPAECPMAVHLDTVARLAALFRLQRHRAQILEAGAFDEVVAVLRDVVPA